MNIKCSSIRKSKNNIESNFAIRNNYTAAYLPSSDINNIQKKIYN